MTAPAGLLRRGWEALTGGGPEPPTEAAEAPAGPAAPSPPEPAPAASGAVRVLYGSNQGTAAGLARECAARVGAGGAAALDSVEVEDFHKFAGATVLVLSTYEAGAPPANAAWFMTWLEESAADFRVGGGHLAGCRVAVFGVGDSTYEGNFNLCAKKAQRLLAQLGAQVLLDVGLGDVAKGDLNMQLLRWTRRLRQRLDGARRAHIPLGGGAGAAPPALAPAGAGGGAAGGNVLDIEELDAEVIGQDVDDSQPGPREMVTPTVRASLTKQGYKVVGTHSGVKLCRWTKSMLRGRGGCYKHAFYGIASHQCMEATPSLACANKCVFCWRHHSNPVGKEWKWQMEGPAEIVEGALVSTCGHAGKGGVEGD